MLARLPQRDMLTQNKERKGLYPLLPLLSAEACTEFGTQDVCGGFRAGFPSVLVRSNGIYVYLRHLRLVLVGEASTWHEYGPISETKNMLKGKNV